uniref:Interleukin-17 n=1 Tax=Strongyloides stercoralis TaxID=6248 RepID=A0A0K0EJD2_STRER
MNYLYFLIFYIILFFSTQIVVNGKIINKRFSRKNSHIDINPYCTGKSNTIKDKDESVMEILDDYRNFYVIPEPKICSQPPENNINSSMKERSLCPYEYRINFDINREPKYIKETVCLCKKSRSHSNSSCYPIKREMPVLKKVLCDITGERYEYVKAVQSITVGCHSALPRLHHSSQYRKIFKHKKEGTIEI